MLTQLQEFRDVLDELMCQCIHARISLWGADSYSGKFIRWYANYYHGIHIDYLISSELQRDGDYEWEIFSPQVYLHNYKDIKNTTLWIAVPLNEYEMKTIETYGITRIINFHDAIFGKDAYWQENTSENVYSQHKTGRRDIQFLEWLEWKYCCNFVQRIPKEKYHNANFDGAGYGVSPQKEVFPILDHCHCIPHGEDRAFDFGCGKGGALVSFLDYGFDFVGGVEYTKELFDICCKNMQSLEVDRFVEIFYGDAASLTSELDAYNWFYFNNHFSEEYMLKIINNICDSYKRKERKITIMSRSWSGYDYLQSHKLFRLTNQFNIQTRTRGVNIYENKMRI